MKIIEADLLEMQGIICHQVNCMGVMGAGLALHIRRKWPRVFVDYKNALEDERVDIGSCQFVQVSQDTTVANLFGQANVNSGKQRDCQTNYDALEDAIEDAYEYAERTNQQLYIPYMMGCGLAGGDWDIVLDIIDQFAPKAIICRLS
jgi:O-acetyl-ADP-ribose deacetylase (regulator of RNase III)